MMPISHPNIWVPMFFKPGYHQHLFKMFHTSSEMILNLTSVHYPGILSSRIPKMGVCEKNLTQKHGKLLGKILYTNVWLQARFQTQTYGTRIPVYECCTTPPPGGMTPFRFQTAQKNSVSLRSFVLQFENSMTSYCALSPNKAPNLKMLLFVFSYRTVFSFCLLLYSKKNIKKL